MGSTSEPVLVLWDIDRTLIDIANVSQEIYVRAFESVVGRQPAELVEMEGRTEQAILSDMLARNDVDPESAFDDFYAALGDAAQTLMDRMRDAGTRLPGAREAVTALAAREAIQSVATGNIRAIAEVKLRTFSLYEFIDTDVGGYGDDSGDRAELVRLARARTQRKYRLEMPWCRVVVIGDTTHDIAGARMNDALSIGVATGRTGMSELAAAGASLVVDRLTADTLLTSGPMSDLFP